MYNQLDTKNKSLHFCSMNRTFFSSIVCKVWLKIESYSFYGRCVPSSLAVFKSNIITHAISMLFSFQSEVWRLEGSIEPAGDPSFSPYLVPDTDVLTSHLSLIRQLAASTRFIIIIPQAGKFCCGYFMTDWWYKLIHRYEPSSLFIMHDFYRPNSSHIHTTTEEYGSPHKTLSNH